MGISDVEAGTIVKLRLVGRHTLLVPSETFRSNTRESLGVGVFAAGDEVEAEVDVFLRVEDEAAQDEVAAVEAGEVAGGEG